MQCTECPKKPVSVYYFTPLTERLARQQRQEPSVREYTRDEWHWARFTGLLKFKILIALYSSLVFPLVWLEVEQRVGRECSVT